MNLLQSLRPLIRSFYYFLRNTDRQAIYTLNKPNQVKLSSGNPPKNPNTPRKDKPRIEGYFH